jgi:hypothetical protein
MTMKKKLAATVALAAIAVAGLGAAANAHGSRSIETDSLVGIPAGLTGPAIPQRGLAGGGIAWMIGASDVEVKANGKVEIRFHDLVFAAGPNLGKNTVSTMKAVISCIAADGTTMNVSTPSFPVSVATAPGVVPADNGGDGRIETKVMLPSPCLEPVVFITTTTDRWLAVNGL